MAAVSTPVVLGNARFTVYTDGCVRLEYANEGKFSPYPSLLVGREAVKPIKADVRITKKSVRIKTSQFELVYSENGEQFSPENLRIAHKNNGGKREVWVPGKRDKGNLGVVRRCLDHWQWCGGPEHHPIEGVLSTDGGHFVPDEPRVYWNTKYNWPQCLNTSVYFDGYFFAYGPDYKQALKDFVTVFGRIPMIPRWAFGFWYSRWYAYTEKDIVDIVKKYRKCGVPFDVMVIDTDWRDGWGGYDWSRKCFPNPERMFKQLKKMNVHTGLNDHPGYNNYDALPDGDSHISKIAKRIGNLPHQGQWACDWSRKEAVEAWREEILDPFFDQGMEFWWVDGWIKSGFGSNDSQMWANEQYYELSEDKTGKRGLILSRWGGIGSHRFPVQFSGDTKSEWGVLKYQIEFTARSGNLGAVYWSHDIGGFMGREIDEELYIRWVQFGAMSPIFRTHSDHGKREPWKFSSKAQKIFSKQSRIRAALTPYIYTAAREAHDTGMPIVRPLYLEYNQGDGGALDRKWQYTIGRDILVAPADEPANKHTGIARKRVYFPKGRWHALETEETVNGTQDCVIDIPLDVIPTYVHEGAIIPCQPVGDCVGTHAPDTLHVDFYPNPLENSDFELYEDDGESREYEGRAYARTRLKGSRSVDEIVFSIGAPRGTYRGMPRKRTYQINMRLEAYEKVSKAEIKVGKGPWKEVPVKHSKKCLGGVVTSGHRFCTVSVSTANKPAKLRAKVK